jgi:anti-anti-sigma factor
MESRFTQRRRERMARTIEELDLVTHSCLIPDSVEHIREVAAEWLAGGLSTGERVVYFEDGTADAVLDRLCDDRVPVDRALAAGQLVVVPTEQTHAAGRVPLDLAEARIVDLIAETGAQGWSGLRMVGETVSDRLETGLDSVVEYEMLIDRVLRAHPSARRLCLYDRRRFDDEAVSAMRSVHATELVTRAVYDDGLLRVTRAGSIVRLAGEADHSNRTVIRRLLDTALDQSLRSGSELTDITLDLASLRFVDVCGAVGLVHSAEEFPDSHRLVLRGPRPRVVRSLHRCGAGDARQLVIEPRPTGPIPSGRAGE